MAAVGTIGIDKRLVVPLCLLCEKRQIQLASKGTEEENCFCAAVRIQCQKLFADGPGGFSTGSGRNGVPLFQDSGSLFLFEQMRKDGTDMSRQIE